MPLPQAWNATIEAIVVLALRSTTRPTTSSALAGEVGVAARYLEPRMQRLVRAGVLQSIRGPRGGYVLPREETRRNLLELIALAEGIPVVQMADHALPKREIPPSAASVVLEPVWARAVDAQLEQLRCTSLAALCAQAVQQRLIASDDDAGRLAYTI